MCLKRSVNRYGKPMRKLLWKVRKWQSAKGDKKIMLAYKKHKNKKEVVQ